MGILTELQDKLNQLRPTDPKILQFEMESVFEELLTEDFCINMYEYPEKKSWNDYAQFVGYLKRRFHDDILVEHILTMIFNYQVVNMDTTNNFVTVVLGKSLRRRS